MRTELSEYETRVVRIFPDYATTVIWFFFPVDYDRAGLDSELITAMSAWERSYCEGLDSQMTWR